jgi:hypothetical protein
MHPDVHRYLDGELPKAELSPEARADLARWEGMAHAVDGLRSEAAPRGLVDDVMRSLAAATPPAARSEAFAAPRSAGSARRQRPAWQRAWDWLVTPRPLTVRPLAPLAGAFAVLLLMLVRSPQPPTPMLATTTGDDAAVVYVQFALTAAGARSVSVAGDFNDWSLESGTLRDVKGDGVFRGLIAVRPGVHKYMFVIDGEDWVTDPSAEGYVDDGFGMRNALLAVAQPERSL